MGDTASEKTFECEYMSSVVKLGVLLTPDTLSDLNIKHDDWCKLVGGKGNRPCKPDYFLNGKRIFPDLVQRARS